MQKLPYDTPLYLAVETDKPVYPIFENEALPDALKGKKVVTSAIIRPNNIVPKITQDIGVPSKFNNAISVTLGASNSEQSTQIVGFKNPDKTNDNTLTCSTNNDEKHSLLLKKAPFFGSGRTTEIILPLTAPIGENTLNILWKSSTYKNDLDSFSY